MIKEYLRFLYYRYIKELYVKLFPINGSSNIIINKSIIPYFKKRIIGNGNNIYIANGKLDKLSIFIQGNNNIIKIREKTRIKNLELWIEDDNCEIIIDSLTSIESAHIAAVENNSKVYIGRDCMISSNVRIVTTDSHSIIDLKSNLRINYAKDVYIGNHVWLGANVSILKGSKILENSVVGINSIVNKYFDTPNVVIAGQPARVVKKNINWERKRI